MNCIVHNWTITSFKIQHSPDFQKPRCGEARTIWFDPLKWFDPGWNSWIQLLFYFFLVHCLKTVNKEQYNLTHVVLKVILQIFIKIMYGLACVAFSNISSRLWLGNNTILQILSIKEIYQVFIQAFNLLILLKIFSHGQNGLTHIILSKKIIKLHSSCVSLLKTFIQKLYVLNHSPLKYFIQVSTESSILFSIFIKSCIFFLYLHHFK